MRVTLAVTDGPHVGQSFSFAGHDTFLVGRSKRAHFRLPSKDRYFSRIHFLLEINPPFCRLLDMGSRNGTHVNGQRVQRVVLQDGDQIRAGKTVLRVSVEGAPAELSATTTPYEKGVPIPVAAPAPSGAVAAPAIPVAAPAPGGAAAAPEQKLILDPPTAVTILPARPPGPPEPPAAIPKAQPANCPACSQPLATAPSDSAKLCSACQDLAQNQPQPIPGYLLVRKLGQGAMGMVYLAVNKESGQTVALKTVTPAVAGSTAQVQRFLREAEILRQLQHPHIVRFRDVGEAAGMFYFAMDYVRGCDAAKLLKREGPLPVRRAVGLVSQLLDALAYAHERGFVHRDIKPSNVLVTDEAGRETVQVVDFGLARVYQASQLSGLTLTGEIGGTMAFLPPEQITAYRDARPAADQFAAAATLYNLLTGCFIHDLPSEFHKQVLVILQDEPVPIGKRRPELPARLCAAVHRGLAREAADRFPDVAGFRKELQPFRG